MTDLNRASVYFPIQSITKADEGRTRIVTGVAASERLDMDGQRADYDWAKAAAGEWFKRWGNVREQHGGTAAGKAISVQFDDAARNITVVSKAVDPGTIAKLDEGLLTGYSWGAKSVPGNPIKVVKEADGFERVKGGAWAELSYVDHPCNYDCTIAITKSAKAGRLVATKVIGELAERDIPGGQDYDAILKALLADIAKRDVSAAERERLGDQGHAIDTGQDHPSYPIANQTDLGHAIQAYGRANPEDRAKLRRHIISEARRLGHPEMIPDGWKSVDALLKQAQCTCCDDCGPDCAGDCCDDCTMGPQKAAAPGPAGILAGVTKLAAEETDEEFRGFLGKVALAVEGWSKADGVAVDLGTYGTLAGLSKAAAEPDLAKRRTFYSNSNRASVEQALQQLHQELGVFMEGAVAADADKDQRDNTLTGQDAPDPGNTPGGPGTAPHDGVSGDGNLAFDPAMVRDGDPAVRTPDGERDGRAQGEAGTHTPPPAGDPPGPGPGDQGKGEAPAGKGKPSFDGQQSPSKAAKRVKKLEAEVAELRKAAAPASQQPVTVTTTLADRGKAAGHGGKAAKGIREEIKALGQELHKALDAQRAAPASPDAALAEERLEKRLRKLRKRLDKAAAATPAPNPLEARVEEIKALRAELGKALERQRTDLDNTSGKDEFVARQEKALRRLRKLEKRLAKTATPAPAPNPLEAQIAELRAVIAGQAQKGATADTAQNSDATLLLMADLTRAAFDSSREDARQHATWLAKRMKRERRALRKAVQARDDRLGKMASDLEALGRLPHPGGPQVARPTDKTFPVNDSIERSLAPDVLKRMQVYQGMAESSDRQVAEDGRDLLKALVAEVKG